MFHRYLQKIFWDSGFRIGVVCLLFRCNTFHSSSCLQILFYWLAWCYMFCVCKHMRKEFFVVTMYFGFQFFIFFRRVLVRNFSILTYILFIICYYYFINQLPHQMVGRERLYCFIFIHRSYSPTRYLFSFLNLCSRGWSMLLDEICGTFLIHWHWCPLKE